MRRRLRRSMPSWQGGGWGRACRRRGSRGRGGGSGGARWHGRAGAGAERSGAEGGAEAPAWRDGEGEAVTSAALPPYMHISDSRTSSLCTHSTERMTPWCLMKCHSHSHRCM